MMALYKNLYARLRYWHYRLLSGNYRLLEGKPIIHQPILIQGNASIQVKPNVHFGCELSPDFWNGYIYMDIRGEKGRIEIGENVMINNGASLTADDALIRIGRKTVSGIHLTIETSDGHSLHPEKRHSGDFEHLSVIVGENVFLGDHVTILKGVSIGDNSVIGAHSVVTKDIPANTVAAGNPCKVIHPIA